MKRVMGMLLAVALAAGIFVATVVESTPPEAKTAPPAVVYVTRDGGKKFHAQECAGLKRTRGADITSLSRDDAEAAGYLACSGCFGR